MRGRASGFGGRISSMDLAHQRRLAAASIGRIMRLDEGDLVLGEAVLLVERQRRSTSWSHVCMRHERVDVARACPG